jgi:hypothetical protein
MFSYLRKPVVAVGVPTASILGTLTSFELFVNSVGGWHTAWKVTLLVFVALSAIQGLALLAWILWKLLCYISLCFAGLAHVLPVELVARLIHHKHEHVSLDQLLFAIGFSVAAIQLSMWASAKLHQHLEGRSKLQLLILISATVFCLYLEGSGALDAYL